LISSLIDFGKKNIINSKIEIANPKDAIDGQATSNTLNAAKANGTNENIIIISR